MGDQTEATTRDRWGSKIAFIMAAVGFAVGFGNVWRFPSLAYEYGGGAFFIPYIMALLFIGIPLVTLEVSLGQYHQTGDVGVFGSIHRRLKGVGLGSVIAAWVLVTYYAPLIAWVINAFFDSFRNAAIWEDSTGSEAYAYFLEEIIGEKTLGADYLPTRMVWANVGYIAVTWFVVWLCLAWGIEATGKVTYFTMGLPAILIFVFLGRAVSLPGASDGINAYIGEWDMSVLVNQPECWSRAVSQIFFSVGVTFGVLTAFGSYCPRDGPAFQNSIIISVCNSLFSFIAGFAVFAGLGYLAYEEGVELDKVAVSGPSLLFGAYPVVLATLPGGIHWVRLLFFTLFLLGIDSAFALTDAVVTVTADSVPGADLSRKQIVSGWCVLGFLIGLLYATDAGFRFLDVFDFYINFLVIIVGLFECVAVGWITGLEQQCEELGSKTMLAYIFTTFGSIIAASGVWFGIPADGNALVGGFVTWFVFYLAGMAVTLFLLKKTRDSMPEESQRSWKELLYTLYFKNVQDYVEKIKKQIGYMPFIWGVLIKHVIPPVLIVVFVLGAVATNSEGESVFGHYGGYVAWPYQILGVLTFCFTAATMLVGAAAPNLYNWTFVPQVEGSFVGEDEKFPVEESEEQDVEQIDESNPEKAQAEDEESEAVEKPVAVAAETKADAEAEAVA